jgi:hypothetical protein
VTYIHRDDIQVSRDSEHAESESHGTRTRRTLTGPLSLCHEFLRVCLSASLRPLSNSESLPAESD